MKTYLVVTNDEFEHPLKEFVGMKPAAEFIGMNIETFRKYIVY